MTQSSFGIQGAPSTFQSQNVYFESEVSSMYWKPKLRSFLATVETHFYMGRMFLNNGEAARKCCIKGVAVCCRVPAWTGNFFIPLLVVDGVCPDCDSQAKPWSMQHSG